MGGNAAKERRRLKRLAEQQKESNPDIAASKTNDHNNADDKNRNSGSNNNRNQQQKAQKRDAPNLVRDHSRSPKKRKTDYDTTTNRNHKKGSGRNDTDTNTTTKEKIKKPKHLKRKMMQNSNDPKMLQKFKDQEKALMEKKNQRNLAFKRKVITLVGGTKNFDEEAFDAMIANGGGKLENIVEAVRIVPGDEKKKKKKKKVDANVKVDTVSDVDEDVADETIEEESGDAKINLPDDTVETDETTDETAHAETMEASTTPAVEEQGEASKETNKEEPSEQSDQNETPKTLSDNKSHDDRSSSSSAASSSDSESDDDISPPTGRTRGRGRKGRQEADAKREKMNKTQKKSNTVNESEDLSSSPTDSKKRRCLGRKPFTDFQVGKKYTGTIVYVKQSLGIFIDIGCHSDAFCHISRIADDFVETITEYKVGDVLVDKVRLVDIDRRRKKITASLQSDDKIEQEEKSNDNWKKRSMERNGKKDKKRQNDHKFSQNNPSNAGGVMKQHNIDITQNNDYTPKSDDPVLTNNSNHMVKEEMDEKLPIVVDPDNMTPMELKRARKLQRRAERRKQQELTGIAA